MRRKTSLRRLRTELEKAQSRFPDRVSIRYAQADLLVKQKRFNEAQICWTRPKNSSAISSNCGFSARLAVAKGGPQVINELNDLSQNIEPFSKVHRHQLLNGLATDFMRLQDLQGASRLWSRLAEQEPNDLELRLNLLELAFLNGNSKEIDQNVKQIEQMDGTDGFLESLLPGTLPDLAGRASHCKGTTRSPATAHQSSCPLERVGVAPSRLVIHSHGLGPTGTAGTAPGQLTGW